MFNILSDTFRIATRQDTWARDERRMEGDARMSAEDRRAEAKARRWANAQKRLRR